MRSGTKLLKAMSILELLIGIGMIIFVCSLLGADMDYALIMRDSIAANALWSVLAAYGVHAIEILGGIIGLIKANKKSILTVIMGVILFVLNLSEFVYQDANMIQSVLQCLTLIVPGLYLTAAWNNYRK